MILARSGFLVLDSETAYFLPGSGDRPTVSEGSAADRRHRRVGSKHSDQDRALLDHLQVGPVSILDLVLVLT